MAKESQLRSYVTRTFKDSSLKKGGREEGREGGKGEERREHEEGGREGA